MLHATGQTLEDLSNLSVLLVDDEIFAVRLQQAVLRQLGIVNVRVAGSGAEALQMLDRHHHDIDVVIADWNAPKLGGADLLRRVRQKRPDMLLIILIARVTEDVVREAAKVGVNGILTKPFTPAQLQGRFRAIAAGRAGRG